MVQRRELAAAVDAAATAASPLDGRSHTRPFHSVGTMFFLIPVGRCWWWWRKHKGRWERW